MKYRAYVYSHSIYGSELVPYGLKYESRELATYMAEKKSRKEYRKKGYCSDVFIKEEK